MAKVSRVEAQKLVTMGLITSKQFAEWDAEGAFTSGTQRGTKSQVEERAGDFEMFAGSPDDEDPPVAKTMNIADLLARSEFEWPKTVMQPAYWSGTSAGALAAHSCGWKSSLIIRPQEKAGKPTGAFLLDLMLKPLTDADKEEHQKLLDKKKKTGAADTDGEGAATK